MSSSNFRSINWNNVQGNELGYCDLSNLTRTNTSYSTLSARHITTTSYNAAATQSRDIVTFAQNLGNVNVTGSNSSTRGDIYSIATGTMLNITNFNRRTDFLNLGSLNANLLSTQTNAGNTIVNYNGVAVATLIGLSSSTPLSVSDLFG